MEVISSRTISKALTLEISSTNNYGKKKFKDSTRDYKARLERFISFTPSLWRESTNGIQHPGKRSEQDKKNLSFLSFLGN
jgi:hypothetical protein